MTFSSCGNVGKLTRICATVSDQSFAQRHPRKNLHAPFLVLGGFADFILPGTYANGHGAIIGLANVAPVSLTLHHSHQVSHLSVDPIHSTAACDRKALPAFPEDPRRQISPS